MCLSGLPEKATLETVRVTLQQFGAVRGVRGIAKGKEKGALEEAEVGNCGVAFVEFEALAAAKATMASTTVVVDGVACERQFVHSPDDERLPELAHGKQNLLVVAFYNVYMQRCCEYLNAHEHVSAIIATKTGPQEGLVVAKLADGPIEPLIESICRRPGFLFYLKAMYPCTHISAKAAYDYSQFAGGKVRLHLSCAEKMQEIQNFENAGVILDPREFATLGVLVEFENVAGETVVLHSGLSKACFDKHLNPGMIRNISSTQYGKDITRAHHKLREVEACHELLKSRHARRAGGGAGAKRPVVLDVGSAPGGWTFFLAEQGCDVVSVDPGKLHPDATQLDAVTHLQMKVEDAAKKGLLLKHGEDGALTTHHHTHTVHTHRIHAHHILTISMHTSPYPCTPYPCSARSYPDSTNDPTAEEAFKCATAVYTHSPTESQSIERRTTPLPFITARHHSAHW
jgi:hypothetical protein